MSLNERENGEKQTNSEEECGANKLHTLLLIAHHECDSFQQVFAASKPNLKGEQWCQLLL